MEQDRVFAHQVVDRLGLFAEGEDVFADWVEAEERFLAVDDVELEQRGGVVDVDRGGGFLDQAEGAQLGHGVSDRAYVAVHDPGRSGSELRTVAEVVGSAWDRQRPGRVRDQDADRDRLRAEPADTDLVQGFLHGAVQGLA